MLPDTGRIRVPHTILRRGVRVVPTARPWQSPLRQRMPTSAPAKAVLLLCDEPRTTLSIARPLAKLGHRVVVARSESAIRIPSRAIGEHLALPGPLSSPAAADALVAFLERTPVDLVIPCTDSALTLVARNESRLRRLTQVAASRAEVLHRVLDKSTTMRIAAELGIPCPKTCAIPNRDALRAVRTSLVFPLVAKPRDKTATARFKVRYYADFDAIDQEFADDPEFGADHLIQEFSTGDGVLLGMLVARGEIVALCQQRRAREWPWSGGVSTTAVTEPPDAVLLEYARRLLTALDWDGVVAVEFRHDPRTSTSVLLEVNGRFWAFNQLAVHAGVNMPDLLMRSLAGQRIHPVRVSRPGVRMIWSTGEMKRAYTVWRNTTTALRPPSLWEALSAPARDLLRGPTHAVWAFDDPLPALIEFTHELRAIAVDEVRALLRPFIPRRLLRARREARARRMIL